MTIRTCLLVLTLTAATVPAGQSAPSSTHDSERLRLGLPDGLSEQSSRAELWSELLLAANATAELRSELAREQMEIGRLQKELDELRQFILDHEEFGSDYEQYQEVKEIAQRESRRRMVEERRKQMDAQRAKQQQERQTEQEKKADEERDKRYTEAGFSPIGLDVFLGRSSFFYAPRDSTQPTLIYSPTRFGSRYVNPGNSDEIDYTTMTISGSILNAADDIRNIGVAITFFDEYDNQIGAEIVQIENARPDVPYPFTAKIEMALNRPFASHASYVLYSDPLP